MPKAHRLSARQAFRTGKVIALIVASMTGFVLMHALFYNYVSSPKFVSKGERFSTALETVLHLVCIVCGPGSLKESVEAACCSGNFESLMRTPFHHHSVSFNL